MTDVDPVYHTHPIEECDPRYYECRLVLRVQALETECTEHLKNIETTHRDWQREKDRSEKAKSAAERLRIELAKRPHNYNDALCCLEADREIERLKADVKIFRELARELSVIADLSPEAMRDLKRRWAPVFRSPEGGGRESGEGSGGPEAKQGRERPPQEAMSAADPAAGKHRCAEADGTWMPDHDGRDRGA